MSGRQHPSREEREAARKYLEHDHAAGQLKGAAAREANRHAQELDDKHPRVRDIALTGTERELGQLPKHLRAHQMRSRKQAGISTEHAARIRSGYRTGPQTDPEREGANPRPNRQEPSPVDRATSAGGELVSTAAGTSWGEIVVQFFTWGAGLSIALLFLTHIRAATGLAQGAANATRALVSSRVDPLNPAGAPRLRTTTKR